MNDVTRIKLWYSCCGAIIATIFIGMVIWVALKNIECKSQGGVLVRGLVGYVCVDKQALK